MTGSIQITELRDEDDILKTLIHLGLSLFDQTVNTREKLEELSVKYSNNANVVIIVSNQTVTALCAYYDNDEIDHVAYISMLVVDKQKQRRGYGTALIQEVGNRCAGKGIKSISLTVLKNNTRAIIFYKSIGFKEYKQDTENLIMRMELDEKRGDQE